MQKAIKILIYFIIGFFIFMFVSFFLISFFGSNDKNESFEVQYVEVTGKNGDVKLHIGMIKDSVKVLVGKPDAIDIHAIGSITFENWDYKIKNSYSADLKIEFENGKIKAVRQY